MYYQEDRIVTTRSDFTILSLMLSVLFFLGWFFQYFGILSQTQTNYFILPFLVYFTYKSKFPLSRNDCFLLFLLLQVCFSMIWFKNSDVFVYIYYLACFFLSAKSVPYICQIIDEQCSLNGLRKFFLIFYAVQLVFSGFQFFYVDMYVSLSSVPIGIEDAVSGSLYIQSDSTLALLLIILNLFFFYAKFSAKDRLVLFVMGGCVVALGSSKALQIFYLLSFIVFFNGKDEISNFARNILFALVLILTVWLGLTVNYHELFSVLVDEIFYGYADKQLGGSGARFAPLGYMLFEDLNIWGYGPLTYYNPVTKDWLYNSGLSTFYSLYIDYGIFGLLGFLLFFYGSICSRFFDFNSFHKTFIAFCAFVYCFFNFILTDVTAVLAIFSIIFIMRMKNERC